MPDHPVMDCAHVEPLLAEVALGIAERSEKDAVRGHLETCASCALALEQLSNTVASLTELIPEVEPPPGFTTRTVEAFAVSVDRGKHSPHVSKMLAIAAALIFLLLGLGLGAVVFGGTSNPPASPTAFVTADFHGAAGVTGQVVVSKSHPGWLIASFSDLPSTRWVTCELVLANGTHVDVGEFTGRSEYTSWSAPVPRTATSIRSVDIVNSQGKTLAVATLS
jgi:hypothetical protein